MPTSEHSVSQQDRWYSVNEVATHLGVAIDTIYRWIEGKGLPAHRIGRLWKCKLQEVDDWVRADGIAANPKGASRPRKRRRA